MSKPKNEADFREIIYKSLRNIGLSPVHGRDAMICPHCRQKVLPFDSGRPDLIVMNRFGNGTVIEVKAIHEERGEQNFAFVDHKENQVKWLDWWTTVTEDEKKWQYQPLGFLAIGTSIGNRLWVIEWLTWKAEIMKPATELGRKSVSISTLGRLMEDFEMIKEGSVWKFGPNNPIWLLPTVIREKNELDPQ